MESLIQCCENYLQYPQNLIHHDALSHNLKAYCDRLGTQTGRLFNERQAAVDFLDLDGQEQGKATRDPALTEC